MYSGQWDSPDGIYSVTIEDDDRVAYAYISQENQIVGDVWLYNVADTPTEPEWDDRDKLPFLNPFQFALNNEPGRIRAEQDVEIDWHMEDPVAVVVRVHGFDWAILRPGAKPGWCRLAKKSGPLANRLDEFQ